MARYKKIDPKMWGDIKFRALSEKAKFLWIYLLTGPHTNSLPGLFVAGEAMLMEALKWNAKVFCKAFREVLDQGLVLVDKEARSIFIPKAIKYDSPTSPNVVKHWGKLYDEIPEGSAKNAAYQVFKDFMKGMGEAYEKAFIKSFTKTSPNPEPLPEPLPEPINTLSGKPDLKSLAREILQFLNQKTGKAYQPVEANLSMIVARLEEGATPSQLRKVIAKKCADWGADEKMVNYLRPKTLFNRTNCANYIGELVLPSEVKSALSKVQ